MKENLNDWMKRMQQMAGEDRDPQEVWSAVSERLGEVQDRLFGPDDGTPSECPDDDRHIADIIAILLEERGFTGEKCSEIHIGLSVEELPVIRELCFRDGTVLRDEPLVSYDLLQSPVRDECKEIEAFWGWIPEQEDDFLDSVRTLLIDKLSGWERVRIDVSGAR